jgi:3-dehydroquinate synthase
MDRLALDPGDGRPRPVLIGHGAADDLAPVWRPGWRAAALVGDERVLGLHGDRVLRALRGCAPPLGTFGLPPGEAHKTRAAKESLEDRLLAAGVDRATCLVAVGGGVALDVAGFVAATLLRGLPHLNVPTSLLAQVDAALGGKTGVNTPRGKNLVGAFHHPEAVVVDPSLLATLPAAEWPNGLAEMVKHAVVADAGLFAWLEAHADDVRRPGAIDPQPLRRCLEIKAAIVADDPTEHGRRRILNFGHSVGHAIEAASGWSVPHGAAVSAGMDVEARAAVRCCGLPEADRARLASLLGRLGLPARPAVPDFDALVPYLAADKKNERGAIRAALPERIGAMAGAAEGYAIAVPLDALRAAWAEARRAP